MTDDERHAFIVEHTHVLPVPYTPELRLHLAHEATELWRKTEEELGELGLPPPFWAFAWAGGQALARYLLDTPHVVRGARVLDFASGSGLVGIAAMRAGAAAVTCAGIDLFALMAIQLNARLNAVNVTPTAVDMIGRDDGWDVILAGDICYEQALAARVIDWLATLAARGATVLIGDPGRTYLPRDRLEEIASYQVPVTRELEDNEVKRSSVWRFSRTLS